MNGTMGNERNYIYISKMETSDFFSASIINRGIKHAELFKLHETYRASPVKRVFYYHNTIVQHKLINISITIKIFIPEICKNRTTSGGLNNTNQYTKNVSIYLRYKIIKIKLEKY